MVATAKTDQWTNWAGNVRGTPRVIATPRSLDALRESVREAARRGETPPSGRGGHGGEQGPPSGRGGHGGETIRVAGAGHSFAPLCATSGTLIDLSRLVGIDRIDPLSGDATIWAGTRIYELGEPLLARGRALANQGDIDRQAIAGAVATGTHGTGRKHGSFSSAVRAIDLMRADGELIIIDGSDPERLRAAALSLGLLGVLTRVTLATVPAYKLRERTRALDFDECLEQFPAEEDARRNAEFWWLPAHDLCVLKTFEETDDEPFRIHAPEALPGTIKRYLKPDAVDWSWRIYPSTRSFPFVEMEYTLPFAAGPAAMREVRHLMQTGYPDCTWAVEYRTQPAEFSLLSPTQGAPSVTISLHQAADQPHQPLFRDAEAIFRAHGGRPHWGKLHWLDCDEIARLYPALPAFRAIQAELDPRGVFTNDYLMSLGLAGDSSSPAP
jgi:FAD/FMN-containing dehydrogenase